MKLTNPFLLGIALMDLACGFWYLKDTNTLYGISMIAMAFAAGIQAFGTIQ